MKKTYQTPMIQVVSVKTTNTFMNVSTNGLEGFGGNGGDSEGGMEADSRGGSFWDDEDF